MAVNKKISIFILTETYRLLDNEKYVGKIAHVNDLLFIKDGDWLKDAAVIDIIIVRNGGWNIYLVLLQPAQSKRHSLLYEERCFQRCPRNFRGFNSGPQYL